ncbi:MAG TPA: hypothetical protein VIM98_05025 [Dyella sp.]|uniref:hypothetical protein n=1 Tax=Dyella sp. TaxID=1869338 RepID=UPI002F927B41
MMTQELFDSIARGDLLAWTVALLPAHISGNADAAYCPRGRQAVVALAQWQRLLAHLAHTAQRCAQPEVTLQLKAFGVRRTHTVVINLAREYAKAWNLAMTHGFLPATAHVWAFMQTLASDDSLDDAFHALAHAYRQLPRLMTLRADDPLVRWLSARAYVHDAQAQAIRRGTWA